MTLLPEVLHEPEADCDECGVAIDRGEPCYVDLERGFIFCSRKCAHNNEEYQAWLNRQKSRGLQPCF